MKVEKSKFPPAPAPKKLTSKDYDAAVVALDEAMEKVTPECREAMACIVLAVKLAFGVRAVPPDKTK